MFVVTGVPRSGTGYASLLFSAVGVPCSHEVVFRPRTALQDVLDWQERGAPLGDSSWLAWTFFGALPEPVHVLHCVRDPWRVIDSLANRNDILRDESADERGWYRHIVRSYCPRVFEWKDVRNRAAQFWFDWNGQIEKAIQRRGAVYLRYRQEDVTPEWLKARCTDLGVPRDIIECRRAVESVPRNVNMGRQLTMDVEVQHPLVRAYLEEQGLPPVLHKVFSRPKRLGRADLVSGMDESLVAKVDALAKRYGYGASDGCASQECAA